MLNFVGWNDKKMLPAGEMLNMLNFFGPPRPHPISSKNPKKFNMFNISAVSLTFFSPKPTDFNISPVGSIFFSKFASRRGNVKLCGFKR